MDKALLDTDILSEVLKAQNANIIERVTAYKAAFEQLTISVITVMEIVKGLHKMQRVARFLRIIQEIPQM